MALVMLHYLEDEGMKLTQVTTGADCLAKLKDNSFDIILMDLGLPDVDGLTLIPQIKQLHNGAIIVISGKTSTTDRIVGLEMGADDYMTKPFEMRELVARIKANTRHRPSTNETLKGNDSSEQPQTYAFGDWIYDASKLAPYMNLELAFALIFDIFLKNHIDIMSLIGTLIICLDAFYLAKK